MVKFKKIGARLLTLILGAAVVLVGVLLLISATSSRKALMEQIETNLQTELDLNLEKMNAQIDSVAAMATEIAASLETSYKTTDWETYERMLIELISTNDMVLGSGFWFEPYAYDANEKYYGPYVYKDGGSIITIWDYSNEDYDYFSQEYYLNTVGTHGAFITDPYYDETSDITMATCSIAIYDNGTYLGCVTVDIAITSLQDVVGNIKIGKTGSGILLTSSGVYLAGVDNKLISGGASVSDVNTLTDLNTDGKYKLLTGKLDKTGWILVLKVLEAELLAPVNRMVIQMLVAGAIGLLAFAGIIVWQSSVITGSMKRITGFSQELAKGNFATDHIEITSSDEIATLSSSLNDMLDSNHDVISGIKGCASEIDAASAKLKGASDELAVSFGEIQKFVNEVNSTMMTTGASTEEVNASVEEVFANTNVLTEETMKSKNKAQEIMQRADGIKKKSSEAARKAQNLSEDFDKRLQISLENAKVVSKIKDMAQVISDIASQINLLSLNASIEAARAGESGRGFAVVASEIGQLATSTSEAVDKIQETIGEVNVAFNSLTKDASSILDFMRGTVNVDYGNFVETAEQYGSDAGEFEALSKNVYEMTSTIRSIMDEVAGAVQNIAESSESTASMIGAQISKLDDAAKDIQEVSSLASKEDDIAGEMKKMVDKFSI
ncbi:MAG: methyl-accepting chemotaxis protein [Lachnospiraceae bacterium]|nr:methyl-accepting chemotaxis protein [Lachnospiraceae bacterium]